MDIQVAACAGACYGVERALKLVRDAATTDSQVQTLGPLIHNPQVVAELEEAGVGVAASVEAATAKTVVIRSHGVVPEVEEQARSAGHAILDATCPYVKRVHHAAELLEREGYQVLVVGEAGHPEVEGILGHATSAIAVSSAEALADIKLSKRVGVVSQTTQSIATLRRVVDALIDQVEDVRVIHTICKATSDRQAAAADLAQKVDVMLVIGGKNSANTTRLAEICRTYCENTHHIERDDELETAWFDGAQTVGITAGASTPQAHIDQIYNRISNLVANNG